MDNNQLTTSALIKSGSEATGVGMDKAKLARYLMMLAVGLGLSYAVWKYIMPWFVDFVWDLTQIIIWGSISAIVVAFMLSQWRNIISFFDILADKAFGKQIQMAPFRMQERKVELAERNAKQVESELGKLRGAYDRVNSEFMRQNALLEEGTAGEKLPGLTDEERGMQTQKRVLAFTLLQTLKVQHANMQELVDAVTVGLKKMKQMIKQLKYQLSESKIVFDITMTGRDAMAHMQKAMQGDVQVNSDAERATLELMKNISLMVGQTQASMAIVTEITRSSNIEDASKLAVARKQLEAIGTTDINSIPVPQGALVFKGMSKVMNQQFPQD